MPLLFLVAVKPSPGVRMQLVLPFESREPKPYELYYVRHRRARRYVIRLDLAGRVRVTIPRGGSRREADAFADRQVDWIQRRLKAYDEARAGATELDAREAGRLRAKARCELPPLLRALAARHGLSIARISVRDQRTRWGSCGHDGHISLNWRLIRMPEWVRDYVLVHELMHLRRMDHSPEYWRLVAAACPEYQEARAWLRRHGPALR